MGKIVCREHGAVGIIAEYNPFHTGHLYHMQAARRQSGAKATIVVLSSNFVQRGEPAFLEKRTRTEMALSHGADLVIELPALYSTHNAGVFAAGAVDILASTGLVTHLSFGMETPEKVDEKLLNILLSEPDTFKTTLTRNLKSGFSYAEARSRAAESLFPGARDILSKPNNTLAISYLLRIREKGYPIKPLPLQRIGGAYHSTETGFLPSATAVRRAVREKQMEILERLPEGSARLIERDIKQGRCFRSEMYYWRILRSVIIRLEAEEIGLYAEMSEGLENRILERAKRSASYGEFVESCKSRRYPRGRIQRHLVHILLGLRHEDSRKAQETSPPYIRILGMNESGRKLLREMRETASVPVLFRHKEFRDSFEKTVADIEYRACGLWENLVDSPDPERERVAPPVLVSR
ncbi:MAG: nucleotidyltransferase family protein [Thermovirgaceae bacterium]